MFAHPRMAFVRNCLEPVARDPWDGHTVYLGPPSQDHQPSWSMEQSCGQAGWPGTASADQGLSDLLGCWWADPGSGVSAVPAQTWSLGNLPLKAPGGLGALAWPEVQLMDPPRPPGTCYPPALRHTRGPQT